VQADAGSGLLNPGVHLMCYGVKPPATPSFPSGVTLTDEFGTSTLNGVKDEELCVPSLIGQEIGG
jgi:hypothetical protein